jgi:hypothetical protein
MCSTLISLKFENQEIWNLRNVIQIDEAIAFLKFSSQGKNHVLFNFKSFLP